jgi:hypothetical protein
MDLWEGLMRVVLWLVCGLILALVPLVAIAFMDWEPNESFFNAFANAELLAVAFTLAGASGVDALTSTSRLQWIQRPIGAFTIVSAIMTACFYIIFTKQLHHLPIAEARIIEFWLFVLTCVLSFFSELVAD